MNFLKTWKNVEIEVLNIKKTEASFYYIMSRFCKVLLLDSENIVSQIELSRRIFGYIYDTKEGKNGPPSYILLKFMPNYLELNSIKENKNCPYSKVSGLKKELFIVLILLFS